MTPGPQWCLTKGHQPSPSGWLGLGVFKSILLDAFGTLFFSGGWLLFRSNRVRLNIPFVLDIIFLQCPISFLRAARV